MLACTGCGGGGGGSISTGLTGGQVADASATGLAAVLAEQATDVPDGVDPAVYGMLCENLAIMLDAVPAGRGTSGVPTGQGGRVTDLAIKTTKDYGYPRLTWTYVNAGDYDLNSLVTFSDIVPVGKYFGLREGNADWDRARYADGNGDGMITVADLVPIAVNYDNRISGYNVYMSDDPADHPSCNGGHNGPGAELVTTVTSSQGYNDNSPGYSYYMYGLSETAYFWIMPTDGEVEGLPSNPTGGAVDQWPRITSITPAYSPPGTAIVVEGLHFGETQGDSTFRIGGALCAVDTWSDTRIETVIPADAVTGAMEIKVGYLVNDFTHYIVASDPVIDSSDPGYLEFGRPFSLEGSGFLTEQGLGFLLLDDRIHPVDDWSAASLGVDFLNPLRNYGVDVKAQVITNDGLESEPVWFPGSFAYGDIQVTPEAGTFSDAWQGTTGTQFTFTFTMEDGSQDYSLRLIPDRRRPEMVVDDEDPDQPGLQFTYGLGGEYTIYTSDSDGYPTALELTNNVTGHQFTLPGPTVTVQYSAHPTLISIAPLNFNERGDPTPNDLCYNAQDDSFLDFAVIESQPFVTTALCRYRNSDGNLPEEYLRDPREFLADGATPRPYCYRCNFTNTLETGYSSILSLKGLNLGNEPGILEMRTLHHWFDIDDFTGWDGNSGWTDTEIRLSLPHSTWYESGVIENQDKNDNGSTVSLVAAPFVYSVNPYHCPVDLTDGTISLWGSGFIVPELDGITGPRMLSIWYLPVTFTSPWTGLETTEPALLTTPVPPSQWSDLQVMFALADLDLDGDGLLPVEVTSPDGTEARLVDARLAVGEAAFFLWSGVLATGSGREIALSGIFSETYRFTIEDFTEENLPPEAALEVFYSEYEAPTSVKLYAFRSEDQDGGIVDFEWDLNNDGIFNDAERMFGSNETECRGQCTPVLYFSEPGIYPVTVRVTDDRGATDTASLDVHVVDDYGDFRIRCRVYADEPPGQIAPTEISVYLGPPATGTLVHQEMVTHELEYSYSYDYVHESEFDYEDQPAGEYWVRVVNPDCAFDTEKIYSDNLSPAEYWDFGPISIPVDSYLSLHGKLIE